MQLVQHLLTDPVTLTLVPDGEQQVLFHRERGNDPAPLGHMGDATPGDVVRLPPSWQRLTPVQHHAAFSRRRAHDGPDQGGFASTIAAEQCHTLARKDGKRGDIDHRRPITAADSPSTTMAIEKIQPSSVSFQSSGADFVMPISLVIGRLNTLNA